MGRGREEARLESGGKKEMEGGRKQMRERGRERGREEGGEGGGRAQVEAETPSASRCLSWSWIRSEPARRGGHESHHERTSAATRLSATRAERQMRGGEPALMVQHEGERQCRRELWRGEGLQPRCPLTSADDTPPPPLPPFPQTSGRPLCSRVWCVGGRRTCMRYCVSSCCEVLRRSVSFVRMSLLISPLGMPFDSAPCTAVTQEAQERSLPRKAAGRSPRRGSHSRQQEEAGSASVGSDEHGGCRFCLARVDPSSSCRLPRAAPVQSGERGSGAWPGYGSREMQCVSEAQFRMTSRRVVSRLDVAYRS